ncbi:MAG: PAS domain S-box protein [Methanomicrobiales archaeon]|nr:PAS domain S-box protein [Methanomicrobiales archaeon]
MQCVIPESLRNTPAKIGALVLLSLFLGFLTIFCLGRNTQVVFTHLYYIPIMLAAFWFQKKGVLYAIGASLFYVWAVITFSITDTQVVLAALARALFFVGIALVIAILSIVIHRQKDEIEQSEEQFHAIWDHIQAGIILIDAETRTIIAANPEAQNALGFSEDEMKGHICHKFICPSEEGKCPVCDLGQTVDRSERRIITRGGKEITVLKTVTDLTIRKKRCLVETFIDVAMGK